MSTGAEDYVIARTMDCARKLAEGQYAMHHFRGMMNPHKPDDLYWMANVLYVYVARIREGEHIAALDVEELLNVRENLVERHSALCKQSAFARASV